MRCPAIFSYREFAAAGGAGRTGVVVFAALPGLNAGALVISTDPFFNSQSERLAFDAIQGRFRRPREERDFVKGRGRTNTQAGNRDHQDRRRWRSSRQIARHRFGKDFQV